MAAVLEVELDELRSYVNRKNTRPGVPSRSRMDGKPRAGLYAQPGRKTRILHSLGYRKHGSPGLLEVDPIAVRNFIGRVTLARIADTSGRRRPPSPSSSDRDTLAGSRRPRP